MSRFQYTDAQGMAGIPGMLPFIPLTLLHTGDGVHITARMTVPALVDSGATVNVLPRDIGEQMGLDWKSHRAILPFAGTIHHRPALALPLFVKVPQLAPQRVLFAWSELSTSDHMMVLLGQTNFFDEFDVNFRKSQGYFDIMPAPANMTDKKGGG